MKIIKLRKDKVFSTLSIITSIIGSSPTNSINVEEMRKRVHILSEIENADKNDEDLTLENDYYELLKRSVNTFPFSVANRDLLTIVDDILNAEDVKK